jgi:hypothetical protein
MDRIRLPAGQVNRVNTHTHSDNVNQILQGNCELFLLLVWLLRIYNPEGGMNEGGSENFIKTKKKKRKRKKKGSRHPQSILICPFRVITVMAF